VVLIRIEIFLYRNVTHFGISHNSLTISIQTNKQQWTLLNYTRIMSYVADRHRIWLARSCPTATTILSVRYRIPVIAHIDKASATNRGPLSRLSSSASRSPANERLTTVARASSSNNVGTFRTRRVLAERSHADLCLGSQALQCC